MCSNTAFLLLAVISGSGAGKNAGKANKMMVVKPAITTKAIINPGTN